MSAPPLSDRDDRVVSIGDVLDHLAAMADTLRAVKAATASRPSRAAIDRVLEEINTIRVALPAITKHVASRPAPPQVTERRRRDPAWARKNDEHAGTRYCPRCERWLPVDQFDIKTAGSATLRYCCRKCYKTQRERYVAANKRAIIIEVVAGDEIVGAACNGCGKPIEVGQLAAGTVLSHYVCLPRLASVNINP